MTYGLNTAAIRAAMRQNGLSVKDVAKLTNTSRQTVYTALEAETPTSAALRIAAGVGVPPEKALTTKKGTKSQ